MIATSLEHTKAPNLKVMRLGAIFVPKNKEGMIRI
jgi:hypothetical protein